MPKEYSLKFYFGTVTLQSCDRGRTFDDFASHLIVENSILVNLVMLRSQKYRPVGRRLKIFWK